ncbi:hypothetical protein G9C98_008564 [Cotesia typhae]|uniref:Protein sprouty n=1 Tax=Cotesia typhae TaxID=2053667 RepID=A0A8J5V6A0_9HYME|nr:hypothetical protein G9C98_008564 [Cotesia typhae]
MKGPGSLETALVRGDEARVTRAGHECEDTISNGTTSTPTLSALPPRPGWAVRTSTGLISSPATPPPTLSSSSVSSLFTSSPSSSTASLHGVQRSEWADCASVLPSSSSPSSIRSTTSGVRQQISASTSGKINEQPPLVSSVSGANLSTLTVPVHTIHHTAQSTGCLPERLEVKEVQMSGQNGLLARPSSSSGSSGGSPNINPSSANNLPTRLHGHDHTRPLPPPRLPETISTIAPLTAPLTPLSTSSSFRTNSRLQSINTAGTITNSTETALDYASCLCCVKGLFYHCSDANGSGDSEVGGSCADEPCSCSGSRKTARWTCLAALTMVLPCLLCYWPLKGCVTICEACYARHAAQGCKCDPMAVGRSFGGPPGTLIVSRDSRDPEKRLLDPVTPDL